MKLCPYPFSRMQTKNDQVATENKGGFFPCCPSWFNQSYWEIELEKNLDDIWNGKAAIELRKKMYEGDYSLCNRNECKIPLMTIDELSNPDVNFIETPISKENLEAIKQKNPIMPMQPSSLHLVADLRCNLKCPTCRPEVISNKTESVEADEEYELVHRLKENVEIIKMSSSGEVFYSQTQRKLLKSFNKVDFPKLRRLHIVSNGTLFNQKVYNDLLPGTEYIKDISISLDAGSKEVYEKIRGPYWEQVVSNLEWLGQMRKAEKFELFTLNCTLIKDNYRDIPNLVALGKKYNVDRILIQKYQFARNQGYKTLEEQEDQAIHSPNHPEHIHMLRTLEMFKDDPLVHTLLELEGFNHKIENNLQVRKMLAEIHKIQEILENHDFIKALVLFNELFRCNPLSQTYLNQFQASIEKNQIDLSRFSNIEFQNSLTSENKEFLFILNTELVDKILTFQKNKKHVVVVNFYIIISHFIKKPSPELLSIVACSLLELAHAAEAELLLKKAISYTMEDVELAKNKELNSNFYSLYLQLAYLHKKQLDSSNAIKFFSEALKLEASEQSGAVSEQLYYLYLDQAFKLKIQNHSSEALQFFRNALSHEPIEKTGEVNKFISDVIYYSQREKGFFLQQSGKFSAALVVFNEALEHGSGDIDLFFSVGICFKRQKSYVEAKKYFTKLLDINPNHYCALMELGAIGILEGRQKEALTYLLQAKNIEPEDKNKHGRNLYLLAKRNKKLHILKRQFFGFFRKN